MPVHMSCSAERVVFLLEFHFFLYSTVQDLFYVGGCPVWTCVSVLLFYGDGFVFGLRFISSFIPVQFEFLPDFTPVDVLFGLSSILH